ncbi:MAG TPA: PorP/SprF family type IX secretion system membrane protein [Chitinophagales bacterium]|nr:PorP/SprF family type IX secretion system membrane protein [Chitinophagales bacterium]
MKKLFTAGILAFIAYTGAFAQDPHFSQIQYNPIYLNPANAGLTEYGKANRIAGLYRDQWRVLPVPYSSTFGSYDRLMKKWDKGWTLGGGVSFLYDRAGEGHLSIFNPNLTMSAGKYFNEEKQLITLGITAGITIKTLDYLGLQFDNQYNGISFDPNLPTGETFANNQVSFPNFTLGLGFRTKIKEKTTLDVGASTSNLHQPDQNFLYYTTTKLPSRHTAYAKAKVGIKDNWNIQPGVFFQNQRKFNQVLINAVAEVRFAEKKDFGLGFGAGYRAMDNDAAIAYLSFLYKTLRVGAAYDFNTSNFRSATKGQGAFELALNYEFGEVKAGKRKKCDTIRIIEVQTIRDTIIVRDTIKIETEKIIIDSTSIRIEQEFNKYLPVAVYFDNDMPDPHTTAATTTANYKELYDAYLARKDKFSSNSSDTEATELFSKVSDSYEQLEKVFDMLEGYLKQGKKITLNLKGYSSPLAQDQYNFQLSKRRIESVKNYLITRNNGALQQYINSGQLSFELLPFGKNAAPAGISDKLSDSKNSIYGKAASLERRVEIINVGVE